MTNTGSFKRQQFARILDLAAYLPEQILSNEELAALYPEWPAEKILAKTGIRSRHVAAPGQTASDMAYEAARALFAQGAVGPEDIDFIILCTQAPDHSLPTSACILQHRLGVRRSAGALDINLGCSGFVYGLSLAKGLIETRVARRVLLLTADTYSKLIHPMDKSVRTLFGDGAVATVVAAQEGESERIGPFVFGTDGSGAKNLIVEAGGFRQPCTPQTAFETSDSSGNVRTAEHLYMNGAEVFSFTLKEVPLAVNGLLDKAGLSRDDIDFFVLHQANRFMLDALRKKIAVDTEKMPVCIENYGNTVSSTIPLTLIQMRNEGKLVSGTRLMLVGFGVGYSWAAAVINF
ncbi:MULTISPECIES: 3-oxoacyl-ACP synthase III family protein [unclassified Massilia]|uniref:3-oxoacyl-ACP synthase III family protein n=1 Tax=unclassified Massilia TaxID=2609279 RepID=UPI00178543EB|nr:MULTISPECIES: ketoacyl-ACP synthase III [unclassified Massilia]MBD8528759.1 ketoacyl-ACP synthase III [Massilia sp. CFBP 13647]MBD8673400.1 ketoacyl-ACP synthase III [Massilia sp. CFBP 13721]